MYVYKCIYLYIFIYIYIYVCVYIYIYMCVAFVHGWHMEYSQYISLNIWQCQADVKGKLYGTWVIFNFSVWPAGMRSADTKNKWGDNKPRNPRKNSSQLVQTKTTIGRVYRDHTNIRIQSCWEPPPLQNVRS